MSKRQILRYLSEERQEALETYYPHRSTVSLARWLDAPVHSIQAYAARRGWHKSPERRKEAHHERAVAANATRKARGDVFCQPGTLAVNVARKGKTWEEIYGVEKAAAMRAKSRQSLRELKNSEWVRRMCGLPPLTRKNYCGKSGKIRHIASRLRGLGYRTDYKTMTAYYSETTQRSEYYETGRRGRGIPFYFKLEPAPAPVETGTRMEEEVCEEVI